MKFRFTRKAKEAEATLDLALKNTELKEEIRALKEQQNVLVRESLRHQYEEYKIRSELEAILSAQLQAFEEMAKETSKQMEKVRGAALSSGQDPKAPGALRENRAKSARTK